MNWTTEEPLVSGDGVEGWDNEVREIKGGME